MATDVFEMVLPYPPSINHYWRNTAKMVKGRIMRNTYISADGLAFRKVVQATSLINRTKILIDENIFIEIYLYPPDKRKRDIDNPIKALLDALQHARVYEDDSQITRLYIQKCDLVKGGKSIVRLSHIMSTDSNEYMSI